MAAQSPVLLVVNDPQRSTPTNTALRALGRVVRDAPGSARLHLLIATGTHRFDATVRERFVAALLDGCDLLVDGVTWHDARDQAALADREGRSFHRLLAEAPAIIVIGGVEPHYFAGFTGPHKTVTIGCMGYADIERNHARAMDARADVLRLRGNPVYDDIAAALATLTRPGKHVAGIGLVAPRGRIRACAAGAPLDVLRDLVPVARECFVRTVPRPADCLHLRVPAPLGSTLYQADKALKNHHLAVRDGGGILLEAACTDGVGPDGLLDLLREAPDYEAAIQVVEQRGYRLGDHKAVRLRRLTDPRQRGVHVALVTQRPMAESARLAGLEPFACVADALTWLEHACVPSPPQGGGTPPIALRIDDAAMTATVLAAPRA
jgi:nickel-dependent lactate racemase